MRISLPLELFEPSASKHYEGSYELPVFKCGPDLYTFDGPLSWQLDITNTGEAMLVMGTVEGLSKTGCARCLETTEVEFIGEIEGYFLFEEPDESLAEEEDFDFEILPEDKVIDVEPLIMSALFLDAPTVPLCQDDCKGLCPDCGANLNDGACSCRDKTPTGKNNPFAVLKDLDIPEGKE